MEFVSKLAKMSSYIDEPVQYQLITENDYQKLDFQHIQDDLAQK